MSKTKIQRRAEALGLNGGTTKKLKKLKENELIYKAELIHFDPKKVQWEVNDLDNRIDELVAQRDDIIKTRLIPSADKLKEINFRLSANKAKQIELLANNGLLAKLRKAQIKVKEIENTLEETDGILNLTKS